VTTKTERSVGGGDDGGALSIDPPLIFQIRITQKTPGVPTPGVSAVLLCVLDGQVSISLPVRARERHVSYPTFQPLTQPLTQQR